MLKYFFLITTALSMSNDPVVNNENIDFNKIKSKKVVRLLQDYELESASDIAGLVPSCYQESDSASYSSHTKVFKVDASIDEVWATYKSINPTQDNRNKVKFGLLFTPNSNKLSYARDTYDGIEEGQIVFWNLKFVMGLIRVPVGQKIMEVNDNEKFIKICYLDQGTSHGTQYIQLYPNPDGSTKVVHYTRYKSESKFRDKRLYPMFHTKAIKEFHRDVRKEVILHQEEERLAQNG